MTSDKTFQVLEEKLKAIKVRQLDHLLVQRHIYQQFEQATAPYAGTQHGAALSKWIADNYIVFAITCMRRMADQHPKTHSLLNFLQDARRHASKLTRLRLREQYLESFPEWARDEAIENADKTFNDGVGEQGLKQLTAEVVDSDIESVKKSVQPLIEIANNWVAHDSIKPRVSKLNLGELDEAIDVLHSVYVRYHKLVTGNAPPVPSFDMYNCEEDFHKVWPPNS